jgi:hypothetical protein
VQHYPLSQFVAAFRPKLPIFKSEIRMIDTVTPLSDTNPTATSPRSQRPSFTRWNDPIARLPFIGHWLLSLLLLIAAPLVALWSIEALGLGHLFMPTLILACYPAIQFYSVSAHRRLLDLGAKPAWALLIIPFWAVSALNAYDGAMASLMPQSASGPTSNREIASLFLLPAVVLHFVLMLRRGMAKSKVTT